MTFIANSAFDPQLASNDHVNISRRLLFANQTLTVCEYALLGTNQKVSETNFIPCVEWSEVFPDLADAFSRRFIKLVNVDLLVCTF